MAPRGRDSWHVNNPLNYSQDVDARGCLSDQEHGPKDIDDYLQHYFGCLEISERLSFLDREILDGKVSDANRKKIPNPIWEHEENVERKNLEAKGTPAEAVEKQATEQVGKKICSVAVSIEAQYKRTHILRQALLDAPNPGVAPDQAPNTRPSPDTHGHLVHNVEASYQNWRDSTACQDGLRAIRRFRIRQGKALGSDGEIPPMDRAVQYEPERIRIREIVQKHRGNLDDEVASYDLERDVNAYLIQYSRKTKPDDKSDPLKSDTLEPFSEELTDLRFKGRFPSQRVSMSDLLGSAEDKDKNKNILSKRLAKDTDPTRIRYLHIPSNNMYWVERVIAGYYEDTDKNPDVGGGNGDVASRTQTHMLLPRHLWRGQQNGARSDIIHARYMRPLCERVSSEVSTIEDNPANIVMFMPYMHWETDRMRAKIARMMDDESRRQHQRQEQYNRERQEGRQLIRKGFGLHPVPRTIEHPEEHPNKKLVDRLAQLGEAKQKKGTLARSATEAFAEFIPISGRVEIKIDKNTGRLLLTNKNPLGQYLLDAARLYEAMSTFRDQQMLEKYLYHRPPMHPRRTLDQSRYWTLKSTKARDRDQVVYRGTNMDMDNCHKLLENAPDNKGLLARGMHDIRVKLTPKSKSEAESKCKYQWNGHWKETDKYGCEHCRNDIRKVSQLIMVDQLWMWVLDDHTIITSFPKRYGYNKHDLSGIHKSIRQRLKSARKNQIRSVYDLALIILDECSNAFFDRTKTEDSQPHVMDIFSESIGNVTSQHTISFQHVWHWTKQASEMYRSKSKFAGSAKPHVPLLDIHPEGKLQREVKDIIDELDMMICIHKKQREMFRRFCKHVELILDPDGQLREGGPLAGDSERENPAHAADHTNAQSISTKAKRDEVFKRRDQLLWFRMQSRDLLSEADDRVEELEGLRTAAASTAQSVNDLLSLKQQQAAVVQAWESAKQAEEAVRQGRSIMMFTVVTVVFLPLSFMTSFFGMNNIEFGSDNTPWTMGHQTKLILLVSFGIVIPSVILAFSNLIPAVIWSLWKITSTWVITGIMTYLPIHEKWLSISDKWHGACLMKKAEERVNKMKEEVRRVKKRRQSNKESEERKAKQKAEEEERKKNLAAEKEKRTGSSSPKPPEGNLPLLQVTSPTPRPTTRGASKSPSRGRGRRHAEDGSSSTGYLLPVRNSLHSLARMWTSNTTRSDSTREASVTGPRMTGTTLGNDNDNGNHNVNGNDNNV